VEKADATVDSERELPCFGGGCVVPGPRKGGGGYLNDRQCWGLCSLADWGPTQ